jgi:hypothetical protein
MNSPSVVFRCYMSADYLGASLLRILMLCESSCPFYNVDDDVSISLYNLEKKIA